MKASNADSGEPAALIFDGINLSDEFVGKTIEVRYTVSFRDYPDNVAGRVTSSFNFLIAEPTDESLKAI